MPKALPIVNSVGGNTYRLEKRMPQDKEFSSIDEMLADISAEVERIKLQRSRISGEHHTEEVRMSIFRGYLQWFVGISQRDIEILDCYSDDPNGLLNGRFSKDESR